MAGDFFPPLTPPESAHMTPATDTLTSAAFLKTLNPAQIANVKRALCTVPGSNAHERLHNFSLPMVIEAIRVIRANHGGRVLTDAEVESVARHVVTEAHRLILGLLAS